MHYTMQITQRLKKLIKSLHQKQFRDQNGLFIAEGENLVEELLKSSFQTELVVIRDSPSSETIEKVEKLAEKGVPVYSAPKHQFDQICDTKSPQTILAIVNIKEFPIFENEPFIALDSVADPGNVGTIIRTASWFGFKQVILGRDCADKFNPKTVRSSMGGVFNLTITHTHELAEYLKENFPKHKVYGSSIHTDKSLKSFKPKKNFGLIFGNEAHGISEDVNKVIDFNFKITGRGEAESLNVAVASGIAMYHFSENML